uniref:Uncharacterized protein n=1 Tax=Rhizophora mucronata TaxID=61149 RepID=A0A2P2MX44_RHIMU
MLLHLKCWNVILLTIFMGILVILVTPNAPKI